MKHSIATITNIVKKEALGNKCILVCWCDRWFYILESHLSLLYYEATFKNAFISKIFLPPK